MRDIIMFYELRKVNQDIRNMNVDGKITGNMVLAESIDKIINLANIARNEGLLALEDAAYSMDNKHLKSLLTLIVDGTDPKIIEEISIAKYFAACLKGYDALEYLIMSEGCLAIQAGEHPIIIEKRLCAMVPAEVVDLYLQKKDNKEEKKAKNTINLEDFYQGNIAAEPGDEHYFQLRIVDYALASLDSRNMQRLLRDVDNNELAVAMKGLSGSARKNILCNLSERLALMIAEDMKCMGPVRIKDVVECCLHILTIIVKLLETGELYSPDEPALKLFSELFNIGSSEEKNRKKEEAEGELHKLLKEYQASLHKTIDIIWKE